MIATFIRLENTLAAAMSVNESPQTHFFDYKGVHLVTSSPYAYTQRTYASDGIEVEDFIIEFFDMCGTLLYASGVNPDSFKVIRNFNDPITGLPQIEWRLTPTGLDFGDQLVYFRLTSGVDGYVYSSPFTLSDSGSSFVTEFWYKNESNGNMLSIGLDIYFRNRKSTQELSNYDPVSTGYTITGTSRLTPFERFLTLVINLDVIETFKSIFLNKFIFSKPYNFSGLPVKTGLKEAIESEDPQADENFAAYEILMSRNYDKTYDPSAPIIIPPVPPVDPPTITLLNVASIDANTIQYSFNVENFTPTYLTFQYSSDGVTWESNTNGTDTPINIAVPNNTTSAYYYRIYHPQATSNVLQLPVKSIQINSIVRPNPFSNSTYKIAFTLNNFTPVQQLLFEKSYDGVVFSLANYVNGNENPKVVLANTSVFTGIPYFRIRDSFYGVTSNIMQYEE